MARADFFTGLVLLCVSGALLAEGWRLPGAVGMIEQGGEPGRVLIFLGFILGALATVLTVRAISQEGHRSRRELGLDTERKWAVVRAAIVAIGGVLYVGALGRKVGGFVVDYTWLTFAFMFAFIVIAEWNLAPEIAARRWRVVERRAPALAARLAAGPGPLAARTAPRVWLVFTAALQAALIAVAIAYVFEKQFFVTLP